MVRGWGGDYNYMSMQIQLKSSILLEFLARLVLAPCQVDDVMLVLQPG